MRRRFSPFRVLGLAVLAGLAGCGPAGDQAPDDPPSRETADFQTLTLGLGSGPCPTEGTCGSSVVFRRDGSLEHVDRGRRFDGQVVAEAERAALISLITSERTIDELLAVPGCPPAIHGTQRVVVEIAPGVLASGDISGCFEGPLAALKYSVSAMVRRLFPQSQIEIERTVAPPPPGARYRLPAQWTFSGYSAHLQRSRCPPTSVCAEQLSVMPAEGLVLQTGGLPRGTWRGVTDFEPLSSVAISDAVIAELRKPSPCPAVTDASESIEVLVGPRMYVQGDTIGCSDGPIADVRAAARALLDRLDATTDRDAAVADHPPDRAPP